MIEAYLDNSLFPTYLKMNGIKECFVWKDGKNDYGVYAGQSPKGFHEKSFTRLKDAKAFCDKMNRAIKEVA